MITLTYLHTYIWANIYYVSDDNSTKKNLKLKLKL